MKILPWRVEYFVILTVDFNDPATGFLKQSSYRGTVSIDRRSTQEERFGDCLNILIEKNREQDPTFDLTPEITRPVLFHIARNKP